MTKDKFLQDELFLPEGAEFVCVINKQGRIETVYKNGMEISKEKKEMFLMGLQLQNSMQSDFDDEFGPVSYTITERENSRFVSMPITAGVLLAKLSKTIDPLVFVNKISELMNPSGKPLQTKIGVYQ